MSSHALVAPSRLERSADASSRRAVRPAGRLSATGQARGYAALGGEPRVSLLPAEVNDFHRARAVRRKLVFGVFAVLALVAAGVAGTFYLAAQAEASLQSARAATQNLLTQEAQFAELRQVQSGIALVQAGQLVGASTEIDWTQYLTDLQATLPPGVTINTVTIDSASPFIDYAQASVPLEGSRIATLSFAATSPTLPSIPDWLDGLATLTGFTDAVPDSVVIGEGSTYLVNMTMHINSDAFSHRFAEEQK